MHPFYEVKYNAIFYNHVWPHLALLLDFLVSDFYYRSKGNIHFPGTYAPGYAFLTSQVYGAKKGTVMGNEHVQLWMPSHALQSDGIAFNYLMGYNDQDLFIAFANTSNKTVTEHIRLNSDLIPWNQDKPYSLLTYGNDGKTIPGTMKNGLLTVTLPPGGTSCIKVKGLHPGIDKTGQAVKPVQAGSKNKLLRYTADQDSSSTITAMIIQPNETMAVFYIYSNQTEKDWKQSQLRYRLNNSDTWTTVPDMAYPFEFDIALPDTGDTITFEITAVKQDGSTISFPVKKLNN
jgi:hypothetical protein